MQWHPGSDGSHSRCPGKTGRARQTWGIANIKGVIISEGSPSVTICSLLFPPKLSWQFCSCFSAPVVCWQFPNVLLPPMHLTEVSVSSPGCSRWSSCVAFWWPPQNKWIRCVRKSKDLGSAAWLPTFHRRGGWVEAVDVSWPTTLSVSPTFDIPRSDSGNATHKHQQALSWHHLFNKVFSGFKKVYKTDVFHMINN